MTESKGAFEYVLSGVSGSGSSGVLGSDGPTPRAEGSALRKPVKDLELIDLGRLRLAAYQITRNIAVAHDIAQNVLTRLLELRREGRLEGIGCLEAFATTAAGNEARNWVRDRSRDESVDRLIQMPAGERFDPAFVVSLRNEIVHTLEGLPHREGVPFILCKVYGYSAEEVAELLGISVEVVWKRVERAFGRLVKAGLRQPPAPGTRVRSLFNRKEEQ